MGDNNIKEQIAIISILFKSDDLLDDFFYSLSLQIDVDFTLFLLNNDENDKTKSLVQELERKYNFVNPVRYIESDHNTGFARGNNLVIKEVLKEDFEYILLANNDVFFNQRNLLSSLKQRCENNKVITPKILYHGTDKIWFSGGHINKYKGLNIHEDEFKSDSLVNQSERLVDFAPACFLMVKKEVFTTVGTFDEKYFVYWEDVDFCLRLRNLGYNITLAPALYIEHKVSVSTGGRASLFSTYYFLRNRLYFIHKHFNGWSKIISLLYIYLTTIIKIIIFDFPRKKVLIKAIVDFKKM